MSTERRDVVPEMFAAIADGRSGDAELEREFLNTLGTLYLLWCDRQKKYGRGNIAAFGAVGCLVRGNDKLARLRGFYIDGRGDESKDESIADSWKDLANYAAMGLMCHEERWPA